VTAGGLVAAEIRRLRLARGWTQVQLGAALGWSQQAVAKLERDDANPGVDTLAKVARALGAHLVIDLRTVEEPPR